MSYQGHKIHGHYSRLWIVSKSSQDPTYPQRIGYINVIPQCHDSGGKSSDPKFETFDQAIGRFNEQLKQEPIQGE